MATQIMHFGDPCIHCGVAHDDVPSGPCCGDSSNAKPVAFRSLGVRHDHVEHFYVLMSDGTVLDRYHHIDEQAPYYHFGYSDKVLSPPRYDATLTTRKGE